MSPKSKVGRTTGVSQGEFYTKMHDGYSKHNKTDHYVYMLQCREPRKESPTVLNWRIHKSQGITGS